MREAKAEKKRIALEEKAKEETAKAEVDEVQEESVEVEMEKQPVMQMRETAEIIGKDMKVDKEIIAAQIKAEVQDKKEEGNSLLEVFVETPASEEPVKFQLVGPGVYGDNFHLDGRATNLPPNQLSGGQARVRIKPWSQLTDQTAPVKHRSLPGEVVPNSSLEAVSEDATTKAAEDEEPSESIEEDFEHKAESVRVKEEAVSIDASQDITKDKETRGYQYVFDEICLEVTKTKSESESSDEASDDDIKYAEDREDIGTNKEL